MKKKLVKEKGFGHKIDPTVTCLDWWHGSGKLTVKNSLRLSGVMPKATGRIPNIIA